MSGVLSLDSSHYNKVEFPKVNVIGHNREYEFSIPLKYNHLNLELHITLWYIDEQITLSGCTPNIRLLMRGVYWVN